MIIKFILFLAITFLSVEGLRALFLNRKNEAVKNTALRWLPSLIISVVIALILMAELV